MKEYLYMEKILSVSGLQKSYVTKGNTCPLLKGVSMEMDRGEFAAVMGPSGSGKTTLVAIGLSLVVFLIQLIIFFFLQKKLVVSTSKIV